MVVVWGVLMRKRIFIVMAIIFAILCVGLGYAVLLTQYGIGLHCPIRSTIGINCPFCGLTRMCLAILRFIFVNQDFSELAYAYSMNPFVIYMSPFVVYLIGNNIIHWIKEGEFKKKDKTDKIIFCLVFIVMLMWWCLRNVFGG